MTSTVVDYENLMSTSFSDANKSCPVSGALPRWKRKQMESSSALSENVHSNVSMSKTMTQNKDVKAEIKQPLGKHNRGSSNGSCRFIPNRAALDLEASSHSLCTGSPSTKDSKGDSDQEYKAVLKAEILGIDEGSRSSASHRILSFKDKAPAPKGDTVLFSSSAYASKTTSSKLVTRQVPSAPSRILDAPDLLDDYYINLLSWSDTNILAVALGKSVHLWNATTGEVNSLLTLEDMSEDCHVSSVKWVQEGGAHLAELLPIN